MPQRGAIFSGLRVIDFGRNISGPAAASILADYGAQVVKLEQLDMRDAYRDFHKNPSNPISDESYAWHLTNHNKMGLALNFKHACAVDVLHRLVRWADVFVTNISHKQREHLGLMYEDVGELNDKIIYADIVDQAGDKQDASVDSRAVALFWARSGLMHSSRELGTAPTLPLPGLGDQLTAVSLYASIATALYQRCETGHGAHVSTSQLAQGVWAAAPWIQAALSGGQFFPLNDRETPASALLNSYQLADGRWILLFVESQDEWTAFTRAIGRADLSTDPRFEDPAHRATNSSDLATILSSVFSTRTLATWRRGLLAHGVTFEVVQNLAEVACDPELVNAGIVVPFADDQPQAAGRVTINSPVRVIGALRSSPRLGPALGEHSESVLLSLGYTADQVRAMHHAGVVATSDPAIQKSNF
jgi:crotonobetainyl-CoA:carnitine CoA-transferase CaiB-like acyl-CoA transferase